MGKKVSDRLERLVADDGDRLAPIKVRLRAGLDAAQIRHAIDQLGAWIRGAEYLSISGTIHGQLSLRGVESVSSLPEVEWVDVERTIPTERLVDPS